MKTLIIHPKDHSTDFLKPIYSQIENKTVIHSCSSDEELCQLIETHDQIMMMGHGCLDGLFSKCMFGVMPLAINRVHAPLLKDKECVYIWCFAEEFVRKHELKGFFTGMFISEVGEASYYGKFKTNQQTVDESNQVFSQLLSQSIVNGQKAAYEFVIKEYGELAKSNPVANYNWMRLFYECERESP